MNERPDPAGAPRSAEAPLLDARGISKSFPGVRALRRVDLQVRAGEIHALLGENGAGKSTLMHILAGVDAPDEGVICLEGRERRFANPREAQEAGVAMVFQERSLAGPLSVAENIFFGRQPARWGVIDRGALRQQAARVLAELGVPLPAEAIVEELSPARQQMVEIAKALSLEARLLVLDEPTSTLTAAETAVLFRALQRLKSRGVGMIYITHRMAEVFQVCDRLTILRDGECQGTFRRDEVTGDDLIARMVGRELDFLRHARTGTAAPGEASLEVEKLHDGHLLQDLSFVARSGEITALAGLAGAGRTELALSIFGARPASAGHIRVNGRAVTIRSPRDAIAAGIGYVPEDRKEAGLFLEMTVAANIAAAALDRFGSWWLDESAIDTAAEQLGNRLRLGANLRRRAAELSGGNQQKTMLARWLLIRPPILIVDEPTRGIDIGAKLEVHQLLRELAGQGTTVVLISSELPEILAVADHILVLHEGRLAGELAAADATEETILRLASGLAP